LFYPRRGPTRHRILKSEERGGLLVKKGGETNGNLEVGPPTRMILIKKKESGRDCTLNEREIEGYQSGFEYGCQERGRKGGQRGRKR